MIEDLSLLANLVKEKLHPYAVITTTNIAQKKETHCEITLKFRTQAEIVRLIDVLNLLK